MYEIRGDLEDYLCHKLSDEVDVVRESRIDRAEVPGEQCPRSEDQIGRPAPRDQLLDARGWMEEASDYEFLPALSPRRRREFIENLERALPSACSDPLRRGLSEEAALRLSEGTIELALRSERECEADREERDRCERNVGEPAPEGRAPLTYDRSLLGALESGELR